MYANNLEQLNSFMIFLLLGIIISILFDAFRILRRVFKTPDIITYIEDVIFWTMTGIIILYAIFIFNNGILRFYIFIGMLIGILLYMLMLSNYVIRLGTTFIRSFITFCQKIIYILSVPMTMMIKIGRKIFLKPISFICINIRNFTTKIVYKLKKVKILNKKIDKKEGIY